MTFKIDDTNKTITLLENVNAKALMDRLKKLLGDPWEEYTIIIEYPTHSFMIGIPNIGNDFGKEPILMPLGTFVGTCETTAKL